MNFKSLALSAGLFGTLVLVSTSASADVVLSNAPTGTTISAFGRPDTQTYGEVFTAPVTGELTSFSLFLSSTSVGNIIGGIGVWNGSGVSSVLYTSSQVASALTNTFSPDVTVLAGQEYVAFLSTNGVSGPDAITSMPVGNSVTGLNGFVYNNSVCCGGGGTYANEIWNGSIPFLDAEFSATFTTAVPEPSTWAMMILGFLGLGFVANRRKNRFVRSALFDHSPIG
jgi:PEP-CTERM motif